MRPTVFPDADQLGQAAATRIADGIQRARASGRRYVLGCPAGRSPVPVYRALAELVRSRAIDLSGLVIALLDEYVTAGPDGHHLIADDLPHSCRGFARERIARPLDLPDDRTWLPDPANPGAYEDRLADAGGIDLLLLASGSTDGHVGFNPPGTQRDSVTRVVQLADSTRRDNLATFPSLNRIASVPHHGVTMGIRTIREHARHVVLVAYGAEKAAAAARLVAARTYEPDWPATVVADCTSAELYLDEASMEPSIEPSMNRST